MLPRWGYSYGYTYSNPYYVESAEPMYDYSQPIVINTYATPGGDTSAEPATESPETTEAYRDFDQALGAFKKGDYKTALRLDEQALQKSPHDPIMHEVGALCMFALGDYEGAAAVLNNVLAVAPGMDWTTMSGLYGNIEAYTAQLRALEATCRGKPDDAAAHFVLAYHYLVAGHEEAAVEQLERVVALKPNDQVAKYMLDAMTPAPEAGVGAAAMKTTEPEGSSAAGASPTTDLVGSWAAERDGNRFELTVNEGSQFTWKATPKGKQPITVTGNLTAAGNALALESEDQGTMVAQVKSDGPDQFQFIMAGSPPNDPGLMFQRVK